ncbi:DUF7168 domain-containing protein [Amorphus sp. MBR-141]
MHDKAKISARIRALLAKTTENGCTEDEAIAAAAKAADMLERYNLTLDEVQVRESSFRRHRETYNDAVGERLWKVASAIADLTGCRYWKSARGANLDTIDFFGFDHEVEVAKYLLEICRNAMLRSQRQLNQRYALLRERARRRKVGPFLDGMVDRLSVSRASAIAWAPPPATTPPPTAASATAVEGGRLASSTCAFALPPSCHWMAGPTEPRAQA